MKMKRMLSILLVFVTVLGLLPGGILHPTRVEAAVPETIKIDFAELAAELPAQDWWKDLEMGSGGDSIKPSAESNEQYYALLDYLKENKNWTINDETSKIANPHESAKKLLFCTDGRYDWAMRLYAGWMGDTDNILYRNFLEIDLEVTEEEAGFYQFSVGAFLEGVNSTQCPAGYSPGSGYGMVTINGETALEQCSFAGGNAVSNISGNVVELKEGTNVIRIHNTKDFNGSTVSARRSLCLNNLTFKRVLKTDGPMDNVRIDFKAFARKASLQPWWNELGDTEIADVKVVGHKTSSYKMPASRASAYGQMLTYMEDNEIWSVSESGSQFMTANAAKRLFLDNSANACGLRYYSTYFSATTSNKGWPRLTFNVKMPIGSEGWYEMDLDVLHEAVASSIPQVDGLYTGSGYGNIYVNDTLVAEEFDFASRAGSNYRAVHTFEEVWLNEGINTVTIEMTHDFTGLYNNGRRTINLCAMEFRSVDRDAESIYDFSKASSVTTNGFHMIRTYEDLNVDDVESAPWKFASKDDTATAKFDAANDAATLTGGDVSFTLSVQADGWYRPELAVLGQTDGGDTLVTLSDGRVLGLVTSKTPTKTWSTVTLNPVYLEAGEYEITFAAESGSFMWKTLSLLSGEAPALSLFTGKAVEEKQGRLVELPLYAYWDGGYSETLSGADITITMDDEICQAQVVTDENGGNAVLQITGTQNGETTVTVEAAFADSSAKASVKVEIKEPAALESFHAAIEGAERQVARFTEQKFVFDMLGDDGEAILPKEAEFTYALSEEGIIEINEETYGFTTLANGDVTVTVTAEAGGVSLSDTVQITVADCGENAFAEEDGNFEGDHGVAHWNGYTAERNVFTAMEAVDDGTGNMAMKLTVNPDVSYTGAGTLCSEIRPRDGYFAKLQPGHMYEISYRVKTENLQKPANARGGYLFVVQMYDYTANAISYTGLLNEVMADSLPSVTQEEWTTMTYQVRAPLTYEGDIYVMPRIVLRPSDSRDYTLTGFSGAVYFDDFRMVEVGLDHVELELQKEPADTVESVNLYVKPVATTGATIDIDADAASELVSVTTTDKDVVEVNGAVSRQKYQATSLYYPTVPIRLVGRNAPAELVANVTLGGFTKEGRLDMTRTDMPDVLREVHYKLDGYEAAVLSVGSVAQGDLDGLRTQLTPMSEEELRNVGDVYFASSDLSVATVDQATGNVTCVGEGTAVITAYVVVDGIQKKDSVALTVTDDTDLVSIDLTAEVDYVTVGNTLRLQVTGKRASGGKAVMDQIPLAYTMDSEGIALVSETGAVTGLNPGTVTITATVGVMRQPITASITLKVVESETLPDAGVVFDFTNGRLDHIQSATLEKDDITINRNLSYQSGNNIALAHKYGLNHKVPVGEGMAFDFTVRRSGWYAVEVRGALYSDGNFSDIFVDQDYVGTIDFCAGKNGAPYSALCAGNTIWVDAGTHTIRFVGVTEGKQYLGRFSLHPTSDPRPVAITMQARKQELLVGEKTDVMLEAKDANGRAFYLKAAAATPAYNNYFVLSASDSRIVVSDASVTGAQTGAAQACATGTAAGESCEVSIDFNVVSGTIASVQLEAERTTVRTDAEPFMLTTKVCDVDGAELEGAFEIRYTSSDETVAAVDAQGTVTITGKVGSAKITAGVVENGREIIGEIWITVTAGKAQPTLYTYEERAIAQENALKYDWAWQQRETAVRNADYVVEHLDQFYNMLIREGLPRSSGLVQRSDSENKSHCPMCKTDLQAIYSHYPWIIDPIENPWKITCPVCKSDFPSNDFEAYYKSGLDEQGNFDPNYADKSLLVNELYPEMGEGWGVDDGFGWITGEVTSTGVAVEYYFIPMYVHCLFCSLDERDVNDIGYALDNLREAYVFTGDEKYGSAGAILIDRVADIYPDYDLSRYSVRYPNSDGGNGQGKFIGSIWEGSTTGQYMAKAADAFWPAMDNPDVIEYLREHGAAFKGIEPEQITPQYVRDNVDEGIMLAIKKGLETYKITGNFGMPQAVACYAAVALDRMPETEQMIDWAFRYGEAGSAGGKFVNTGGNVMYNLVNLVDRDGFGDEVSCAYLSLWASHLSNVADALDGYTGVEDVDLWQNSKFVSIFKGYSQMIVCGELTPLVGETGAVQGTNYPLNKKNLLLAYTKTRDPEIAQALYFANGNSADGLHGDIFTKNPESIRNAIRQEIDAHGELDFNKSLMVAGYGLSMLKEGPDRFLGKNVNRDEFSAQWMYFGHTHASHAHLEALSMDLYAFGLNLSSTMGYPLSVTTTDPLRMQWMTNTVSHNLVVVDDEAQSTMYYGGFPMHFDDAGKVKVMDAEASAAYPQTDIYRRTMVNVAAPNGQTYTVDFFRVLGGSEHVYSFHAATMQQPAVEGLDFTKQPMGTYLSPDVPLGEYHELPIKDVTFNQGSGYSWLDDVYRDADPETSFTLDYPIEDFRHQLTGSAGIHLKLTMLSEEPMTEVALANGHPPQNGTNPEHIEYVLVRRSGEPGMDSLFTAVIEPYQSDEQIETSELVDVVLIDGEEIATDQAKAIKVTMFDGREDYIVYATNYDCTYRIDDKFNFRGFTGVCSYYDEELVYAYGNEAAIVANVITDELPAITGTVTDFTEGLTMDDYTMTIQLDQTVTEADFEDRYIYVNNDGERNAAYRIHGVTLQGNTAVLNLHDQTLVRRFVDGVNMDLGYVHNIARGQSFKIPTSVSFDMESVFKHTPDQVVKAGNKMSLTCGVAGSGVSYKAEGLPAGAKVSAADGTISWTPTAAQAGRYTITVYAMDGSTVLGEMSFVLYVVSYTGSTYPAASCAHAKAVTYTVDGIIETVCPACGTIMKREADAIQKFDLAGANMTLGNELKLNFLVKTADLADGEYTAKITHNGEVTEEVFERYNSGYQFVSYAVSAKQMADTISVVVYDENGNEVSNVYETSVRAYAMNLLGNKTLGSAVKTLLVDMLNYGSEAQNYFSYNTEDLANSLLTDAQKALATAAVTCTNKQVKGENFYGANLSLEDRILLNIFFKNVTEGMTAKITFTDYAGVAKSFTKELVLHSGGTYKVIIDEIVLADAFSPVTVTVYNADGTIHGSGTDSVESYIARTGSSALNDAIMKFAYSAKAYLG